MTNEKMLECLYKFQELHGEDPIGAVLFLDNVTTVLKEDIRSECMKAKGLQKRDKLIKSLQDDIPDGRAGFRGWHPSGNGMFGFVDGYRVYVTDEDYGYQRATSPINLEALIPRGETRAVDVDLTQVRVYIKDQKAKVRAKLQKKIQPLALQAGSPLDPGSFQIGVNPEYLLEFCTFFQTSQVYARDPLSALQYCDPETQEWGILLPCRP